MKQLTEITIGLIYCLLLQYLLYPISIIEAVCIILSFIPLQIFIKWNLDNKCYIIIQFTGDWIIDRVGYEEALQRRKRPMSYKQVVILLDKIKAEDNKGGYMPEKGEYYPANHVDPMYDYK